MFQKKLQKKISDLNIVGVDDGRFIIHHQSKKREKAPLFCILWNNLSIRKVKIDKITVDGLDSTQLLLKILKFFKFDLLMFSGISFGGFNIVDAQHLYQNFKKPIIIITGTKPRNNLVKKALKNHFLDWRERFSLIKQLGKIYCIKTVYNNPIYFEVIGLNYKKAKRIIQKLTFTGRYPEPIRVIKLLANDLV